MMMLCVAVRAAALSSCAQKGQLQLFGQQFLLQEPLWSPPRHKAGWAWSMKGHSAAEKTKVLHTWEPLLNPLLNQVNCTITLLP